MIDLKHSWAAHFYDGLILAHPGRVLTVVALVVCFLGIKAQQFALDASSETLMLQSDEDLQYARQVSRRYGSGDFLVLTYTPHGDLFSPQSLKDLERLRNELRGLRRVRSVNSLLDVPLLESPPVAIKDLRKGIQYLTTPGLDMNLARQELRQSPLYQQLLISKNLNTTALLIHFEPYQGYAELRTRRNDLREKHDNGTLSTAGERELSRVTEAFRLLHDQVRHDRHLDILTIRNIADRHRDRADLFLGGVSMISDDMITYIKNDLRVFGTGVVIFLILALGLIFRDSRWVILPLLCCLISVVSMIGLLGWFGWEVTVISSNFISLQLIMTMAVAIHLIVRYRELLRDNPEMDNRTLLIQTMCLKLKPCLFATLTTVAGFGSLLLCNILPVITFGWMMIAGLFVSLLVTFVLFPTVLIFLPKPTVSAKATSQGGWAGWTARITQERGRRILWISGGGLLLGLAGIAQLEVENSFIDYFKSHSEIYQGMRVVDQELGGTTPLDLILHFDGNEPGDVPTEVVDTNTAIADEMTFDEEFDEFAEFDDFEDEFTQADDDPNKYWFTPSKMERVRAVHRYLDNLPATGKVLSLATTLEVARRLNEGKPLDGMAMALLFNEAPEDLQKILITPYVSVENNEARFSMRIEDSMPGLRRNELLETIRRDLKEELSLAPEEFRLSGIMVLYNNMLQSLFDSQILTLGITVLLLLGMFLILFRSLKVAAIAIAPNLLSIAVVLGFMGWAGLPLDLMTITIAAISVGIAVDDTIHYIHRFRDEFAQDRNYLATMHRCHHSIGHAMTYTSITIILGFSILAFSNFIPTIYFGLLTSLAMLIALVAALTLLPQLIIMTKPFGPEKEAGL